MVWPIYPQMAKKPTRLELHRLTYHKAGKKGSLLMVAELDPEEHAQLSEHFFGEIRRHPGVDPYDIYSQVMADWGIMCHHPQTRRLYEGKEKLAYHDTKYRWFMCTCCKAHVISRTVFTPYKPTYNEGDA